MAQEPIKFGDATLYRDVNIGGKITKQRLAKNQHALSVFNKMEKLSAYDLSRNPIHSGTAGVMSDKEQQAFLNTLTEMKAKNPDMKDEEVLGKFATDVLKTKPEQLANETKGLQALLGEMQAAQQEEIKKIDLTGMEDNDTKTAYELFDTKKDNHITNGNQTRGVSNGILDKDEEDALVETLKDEQKREQYTEQLANKFAGIKGIFLGASEDDTSRAMKAIDVMENDYNQRKAEQEQRFAGKPVEQATPTAQTKTDAKPAEAAKPEAAQPPAQGITPKNESVTVEKWGTKAADGQKYANDCLSHIIANNYPDVKTGSKEYKELTNQILNDNPKAFGKKNGKPNKDVMFDGATINLPTLNKPEVPATPQAKPEAQPAPEVPATPQAKPKAQPAPATPAQPEGKNPLEHPKHTEADKTPAQASTQPSTVPPTPPTENTAQTPLDHISRLQTGENIFQNWWNSLWE